MEMERIREALAVAFDLRGTLIDPESGWRLTDAERIRFLRACGARASDARICRLIEEAVAAVNELALEQRSYFEQDRLVLERVAAALGLTIPAERLAAFERWRNRAFARSVRAYPDAAPTLRALRSRGVPTACVADGRSRWTRLVLERSGLLPLLDVVVASKESGEVKATGAALRLACERLRLDPADVVYVGDRMDKDVLMAERVGCIPVLLDRASGPAAGGALQISSLEEILRWELQARFRHEEAR